MFTSLLTLVVIFCIGLWFDDSMDIAGLLGKVAFRKGTLTTNKDAEASATNETEAVQEEREGIVDQTMPEVQPMPAMPEPESQPVSTNEYTEIDAAPQSVAPNPYASLMAVN